MIRLSKQTKPQILVDKENEWTTEYMGYISRGERPPVAVRTRYRHAEIKAAISQETNEKCAYCESKILHAQHGDTEHIRPVSKQPQLIVAWENLTLACRVCNFGKLDYDSDAEPLVHPYDEDPEDHINFVGPYAFHFPGDAQGQLTIDTVDLNRGGLVERRQEKLEQLQGLLDSWARLGPGNTKEVVKRQIVRLAASENEFASVVRRFLWQHAGIEA